VNENKILMPEKPEQEYKDEIERISNKIEELIDELL
jgi:hypothetical protein